MKALCLYHRVDLDGWMSAAILRLYFERKFKEDLMIISHYNGVKVEAVKIGNTNPANSLHFYGYNYGDPIPPLLEYDKVYIVDISLPMQYMIALSLDKKLIWIDHHISAISAYEMARLENKRGVEVAPGERSTKFAACELAWQHFFEDEITPEIVYLLGMYDSFRHKGTSEHEKVLSFQYGARASIFNPEGAFTALVTSINEEKDGIDINNDLGVLNEIYRNGSAIYQYLCTEAKQVYSKGFVVKYGPYNFLFINRERFNPVNYGIDYHADGYDAIFSYFFDGDQYNFSIYNDNGEVDCSKIAKGFGGGGHKGAAGFRTDDFDQFINLKQINAPE